ncbi:serine/threonine-protein kinase [Chondromyces crocatus]|uniref:Protein kinase domain-containing protein n=1 Tax=Chondromyces crocatus TaxID=52 RepID=A0A0K1ESW8_CHOCO|nr:serine/threonine-protein kinase [Chondromyces crocatus]AKT43737.1 uncharacterized protein CMC5_079720 [Chondromyces crocatus]
MTSQPGYAESPISRRAQERVGHYLREKWRLERLLGVGGMAAVYQATHRNGMRGAVKMLHLEFCANEEVRQRFLREGYVANRVDHPGAVRVLDDDVAEDGSVFLVMELLEGATLESLAESRPSKQLEVDELLAMADALLDVLVVAHGKGIVHRDIKPENLFYTRSRELKVLDFGIARVRELHSAGKTTQEGSTMGTPAFMPPEQALGNWSEVDERTDLWSVGATMFTLLTGRLVHDGDTMQKLLLAAMTKPAPALAQVAPGMPPEVCTVIDRALSFTREQRWPDAAAMQQAVRRAREAVARGSFPLVPVATVGSMPPLQEVAVGASSGHGVSIVAMSTGVRQSADVTGPVKALRGRWGLPIAVVAGAVFAAIGVFAFLGMGAMGDGDERGSAGTTVSVGPEGAGAAAGLPEKTAVIVAPVASSGKVVDPEAGEAETAGAEAAGAEAAGAKTAGSEEGAKTAGSGREGAESVSGARGTPAPGTTAGTTAQGTAAAGKGAVGGTAGAGAGAGKVVGGAGTASGAQSGGRASGNGAKPAGTSGSTSKPKVGFDGRF